MLWASGSIGDRQKLKVAGGTGSLLLSSLRRRPGTGNLPRVCCCLRLIPKARVGKTALKTCPKETGRLNSHACPGHFREGSSSGPHRNQSGPRRVSPPLRGGSEKKIWFLGEPPHFQSGASAGTQAPSPSPAPSPARQPCRAASDTAGGGAPAPPGARDSRSHALPQLAGAPSPTDTPFLRRRPRDPLRLSGSSLTTPPNCSKPFHHSQLQTLALSARLSPQPLHSREGTLAGRGRQHFPQALGQTPPLPRLPCPAPAPARTHCTAGAAEAAHGALLVGWLVITEHATHSENTEERKRLKKCYLGNHRRSEASWWAGRGGCCPPAAGTLLDYAYS